MVKTTCFRNLRMVYLGYMYLFRGGISVSEVQSGIHPLWGSFSISYKGQVAWNIPFDADATEMTAALDENKKFNNLVYISFKNFC